MNASGFQVLTLAPSEAHWPRELEGRLGKTAPSQLWTIGNPEILSNHKVGLFCSVRCPGNAAVAARDAVRKLRDEGITVVSGFHSPVEKECLQILLEGEQPIVICLARAFGNIRIPRDWRLALESDRLLLLSSFDGRPRRLDTNAARRRNELVAALSDEVLIIYAQAGGAIERISKLVDIWGMRKRND